MSRFLVPELGALSPYVPGEQPQGGAYIKLNTNENPYPPSPAVIDAVRCSAGALRLYPDPDCRELRAAIAEVYSLPAEQICCSNGSDEMLAFIFRSFCPKGAAFADITYGFYKVWAQLFGLETEIVPLRDDFSLALEDYDTDKTVFIANPNAPTGVALPAEEIARFAASRPDRLVVVDEAYVDFGAESCLRYAGELDNLLVVQTFSKSRNLAGGRVAFAAGAPELIRELETLRFSFHPYSVGLLSQLAGAAAVRDRVYFKGCCAKVAATRDRMADSLEWRGFTLTDSKANFLFARHPKMSGGDFYRLMKEKGVLIRWFDSPRIRDFVRISVGSDADMDRFLEAVGWEFQE